MTTERENDGNAISLTCLYSVSFVDTVCYAMILPLLPGLLQNFGRTAVAGGILSSISFVMTFLCGPLLGLVSDKVGRKPVLLTTVAGVVAAYLCFGLWSSFAGLVFSRAFAGAMAANIGVVQAAVAEHSSAASRGTAMSRLTVAWGLGFVVGPILSIILGYYSEETIVLISGLAAACCAAGAWAAVLILYRDPKGQQHQLAGADPGSDRSAAAQILRGRDIIAHLACLAFCQAGLLAMTGFLLQTVFGWDARQIAVVMLCSAVTIVFAQWLIVPRVLARFGEIPISRATLALTALMAAAVHFAGDNPPLVVACVVILFTGITMNQTALKTLLSKRITPSARGVVMGSSNSASAFGRIIGPIAFGGLFAIKPTVPYLGGCIILIALLTLTRSPRLDPSLSPNSG
jgi:predicted MFS family arabinose efflux permease